MRFKPSSNRGVLKLISRPAGLFVILKYVSNCASWTDISRASDFTSTTIRCSTIRSMRYAAGSVRCL